MKKIERNYVINSLEYKSYNIQYMQQLICNLFRNTFVQKIIPFTNFLKQNIVRKKRGSNPLLRRACFAVILTSVFSYS